jgi:hypothetical protein
MKFPLETNLPMKVVKGCIRCIAYDWPAVRELPNEYSKQGLHDSAYLSASIRTVLGLNGGVGGLRLRNLKYTFIYVTRRYDEGYLRRT